MQIDMDILKYTQQYLMSRVVDCRVRLDHQDRMFSVKSPQIPAITPRPRKPRMPDNLPVANLIYTTTTKATTEMTALELTTENVIETTGWLCSTVQSQCFVRWGYFFGPILSGLQTNWQLKFQSVVSVTSMTYF